MSELYFAYGSNLHPHRLASRLGTVRHLGVARLPGYRLRFNKCGGDGSSKANIEPHPGGLVYGALYRLDGAQWSRLDQFEVRGHGYERVLLHCETERGPEQVSSYRAMAAYINHELRPFSWYKGLVQRGAHYLGFPEDYLAYLEALTSIEDPDPQRQAEHRALLERM